MSRHIPYLPEEDRRDSIKHPCVDKKMDLDCGQIISKGTRELLEKMQHPEIGRKRTQLCGHDFKAGQIWVLSGLSLLFILSLTGTLLMWFTEIFDNAVLQAFVLANNSVAFNLWYRPPVKPLVKVYIFNYTNLPDFERGVSKKLHVKEVGPYVYEELLERINVEFSDDGTITYRDRRSFKFSPQLSKGRRQSDRLIVPNMPMLGAAAMTQNSYYFARLSMNTLLTSLNAKPFINLPAHRFIWGYDDNLYNLAKGVLAFSQEIPFDRFGILANKNGTSKDLITISSGEKNIDELGYVKRMNGHDSIGHWSTDDCNRVSGSSDGSIFPPRIVRDKKPINIYQKDMCRRLPLVYGEEVLRLNDKIPAYRYYLPTDVFDSPEVKPENQCYCDLDSGNCPPQGVFNATPCSFGAPAFMSLPHFYNADPSILEYISGLAPNPKEHLTYLDLHPRWGYAMGGKTRLQMNIQVKKSFGMSQLDAFENDMMLPVAWIELGVEDKDLTDDLVDLIYQTTYTIRGVELALQYGCLLTVFMTLISIGMIIMRHWRTNQGCRRSSTVVPLGH